MYNLLSDKLDRFEREIRKGRNMFFGKLTKGFFAASFWFFRKSRAYLHTEILKNFKDQVL